ncbi:MULTISPECIES: hypothetical protein [Streptomyces]|uniref:hypothetical protein n=1 Tax=Streptomyces TaxID=1883 RepID=UPI001B3229DF|nr:MULTISPECIES: hypothetical protein [Streptomyces]MBP5896332.1 hypothetical protein [Streptomyces sp. LBUM 1481]MBP5926707.1 hypothetical protein [Streptomyces sp. LBUM 1483]MDX3125727.1 hypothetical protein [Streptomyces scabiei]MDX3202329.1 hypothetical protein [Streptomyces scabiei]MDX3223117.1 hypothetical protein [Streptomyces scabiei]
MNVFGDLGTVGVAFALTVLLFVGIPGGGKLKPLGWWTTFFVAMLAGSAYEAAGGMFQIVPDMVGSAVTFANGFVKGLTLPAIATSLGMVILWKKMTTKQVAVVALVFFYVASGAGGNWAYISDAIENARVGLQ